MFKKWLRRIKKMLNFIKVFTMRYKAIILMVVFACTYQTPRVNRLSEGVIR